MTEQERRIKFQLLDELISEMGGTAVSQHLKSRTNTPVAQVTETKEVPVEKLPDLIKEKLEDEGVTEDAPEDMVEPEGEDEESPMPQPHDPKCPGCEMCAEDDSEDSDFIQRLKAAKAKLAAKK